MRQVLTLVISVLYMTSLSQEYKPFETSADVGNPKIKGSTSFNADQSITLTGSGYNIWFERDEFHYAHDQIDGDFLLTANFSFEGKGVDAHRKVGWMIRESLDEDSRHISATLHGDGLTVLQWRPEKGASMRDPEDQVFAPKSDYDVLQLERAGRHDHNESCNDR